MTATAGDEAEPMAEPLFGPNAGSVAEPMAEPTVEPFVWAPPVPVLAPYVGLVSAVLCALGGGWLLLAPYALDYRHGAPSTPRTTEVDLATGAAVVAVAIVSAAVFSLALARRLRTPAEVEPDPVPAAILDPEAAADVFEPFVMQDEEPAEPAVEPEPTPASTSASASAYPSAPASVPIPEPSRPEPYPDPDPNNSLRELLTPLVAALAADLKSRADNSQGGASR
jgi:hypothetical protein